ncbi:MAG: methylmalonyl-CoA epimerase [Bacteroidota bacterium]
MPHLEHIGISVRDAAAVAALYDDLLGLTPYKREAVEREGVQTHFIQAGQAKLELLEALGPDSPIAKALDKRGEGLHHLAFEVQDLDAHLERLRGLGYTPLSDTPRPGADGKRIFFLHPKQTHGVLIELCESTLPAGTPLPAGAYRYGPADRPVLLVLAPPAATGLAQALAPLAGDFSLVMAPHAAVLEAVLTKASATVTGLLAPGHAAAEAVGLAQRHPDRLARLVLVAPGPLPSGPAEMPTLLMLGDRAVDALDRACRLRHEAEATTLYVAPGVTDPLQEAPGPTLRAMRTFLTAATRSAGRRT